MERRQFERKTIRLKAERVSGDENHSVFIENISESGIYMVTAPADTAHGLDTDTLVNLKLKLSNGETLDLQCRVIWAYSMTDDGSTNSVGMELIDPPLAYKEFVRTLR